MSTVSKLPLDSVSPLELMQLSRPEKVEVLQRYRVTGVHNPHVIFFLATDVVSGGSGGMDPSELYDIYEQVLIASLETGRVDKALMYLDVLERRFGKRSNRVRHLKGLCYEAEGKTEEAYKLYEVVRKEHPTTDYFAVKRLSAMYKAEGKYREAIDVLEEQDVYTDEDDKVYKLMEIHCGDVNVYKELSQLYYLIGNLDKAIFYLEETFLYETNSYLTHSRLGELYYAKKDYSRCAVEYSQSLLYNDSPNNTRAAYALWQVCNEQLKLHQSGVQKLDVEKEKQAVELREFASETLHTMYAKSQALPALEAFLEKEVHLKK